MADEAVVRFRLHKNYEKFTGLLNGVYQTKDGIVTLPADAEKGSGRVLKEYYGATKIDEAAEAAAAAKSSGEKKA